MDATQMISDSILESDEESEDESENKRGRPLAKLCILKNAHIPETELPLFLGDNVLGRDPNTCTLPLPAPSISKQHATICISAYRKGGRHSEADIEALVWDLGSMNGTRKGHMKMTPNVRYALSESDSLVVADIPCQYVSCAVDAVSSQVDMRTPVSRNSGVKARLPHASGQKGGYTSTGSKKYVNGGTLQAKVSLPDQGDTMKTPGITSVLSFEQTPTHPEGSLVPESDSDSDGERGDRRRKAIVSDSDSHKSSPTCSTFLSPTNKIVPESEDESPITLSSSTKNRPHGHVSFSNKETYMDAGRQQLNNKNTLEIVVDSEEEEEREEERAALGGTKSEERGHHVPMKQGSNVSLTGEDELPVFAPSVFTDPIPVFDIDSDTDVEGQEEEEEEAVISACPVTLPSNQQADQPPDTAQFHMDSDTDVDEDDDALDKVPKSLPSPADHNKPHVISVIQPAGITMDSDTDVDDDDEDHDDAMSDAATNAKPPSLQSTQTADSAPLTQVEEIHLNSDTDIDDEEEEKERGTNNKYPKIDETSTRSDIRPKSIPAAPHSLQIDSDTDDEAIPAPALGEPSLVSTPQESCTTAQPGACLDFWSDSDTDVEDDSPLVIPLVISDISVDLGTSSDDSDTDVDESIVPPAADLKEDSETDVEDKEVDLEDPAEGQIPSLQREITPEVMIPLQQNCSTPVFVTGAVALDGRQILLSPSSESQEDEDFVVAETQSFVLQTRECQGTPPQEPSGDEGGEHSCREAFLQLGLSDSSHLQGRAQALAMESTQAFVGGGGGLEDTQAYAAASNADRASLENDPNLEATQSYGNEEEPARCSEMSGKESQVEFALEETQAYITKPCSDSEDETDDDETKNNATADTQAFSLPTSSTLATAETQLMPVFEEEESSDEESDEISCVLQVKPGPQNGTEEHGKADQPQKKAHSEALSVAETQPMHRSEDEESDDDDSMPGPRKRKAKQLQLEDEQTQTNSELSAVQTRPMEGNEDGESDEEDLFPGRRKRKAQHLKEEESQPLTSSEVSAGETQLVVAVVDEQSDDEDSILGPRKRKAKQLQLEDEQTQTLTNSELSLGTQPLHMGVAETQPMATSGEEESEDEDCMSGPRRRQAKQLQLEDEQTQTNSELSAVQTQPMEGNEDGESDEEDLFPGRRKRKVQQLKEEESQPLTSFEVSAGVDEDSILGRRKSKAKPLQIQEEETQPLTNSEASTVETEMRTGRQPPREKGRQSEAGNSATAVRGTKRTRARLQEEEQGECSEAPTTRGRRGELRPNEEESEEEKEPKQGKRTRGKTSTRKQKDKGKEEKEEREELERKEKEIRVRAEHAERFRLEFEREGEVERIEREREELKERERAAHKEKEEQLERERKEKEEQERLKVEKEEKERLEKERKQKEEEEEEQKRLKCEKAKREEKERLEKEENERIAREGQEKEEKERLEATKTELEERLEKERTEQEHQARLEREAREKEEGERLEKEKQEKQEQENKSKTPARSRRAARRTIAAPCSAEAERDSANDDVPARRTRSRSNSSNSVSSERSASSVSTQGSRGRGRGRGAKRTSAPPPAASARGSNRRRTTAAEPTQQDSTDTPPSGPLSRSNSLISEVSSCSVSSRSRGRGGRQRGRGRKTEPIPTINIQSELKLALTPAAGGSGSSGGKESSNELPQEDEKADSQQATSSRGRRRANANILEPNAAGKQGNSSQECGESPLLKRSVRGRTVKSETVETPVAPAVSDGDKGTRKGRKRQLEANAEEASSSSHKVSKGKEKALTTEAAEEEESPVQAKRRGRASSAQTKKNAGVSSAAVEGSKEKTEEVAVERRVRGRPSMAQKKKKEEQEESGSSVDQDQHQPQTPTSAASRKRQAPADSSPVAKTLRFPSASPGGRSRAASPAYKVLYTGVVDEEGEKMLARLGGSMAKGVADMNCLVTDKVRRTVKFLCALAKGIPIVTTHWLVESSKAGRFLSPNAFVVKDPEQEKNFSFCLQHSLTIASSQPLLQGYGIHVTKSVKPEPVHMKDIIFCSGGTLLPNMPSSLKPQTVVISCEEDLSLCGPAFSATLPVVTAEFILTGILQQRLDLQTYRLSAPAHSPQPAGGRGRSRKKT